MGLLSKQGRGSINMYSLLTPLALKTSPFYAECAVCLPDVSDLRQSAEVTGAFWLRACPRLRLNWLLQPLFPGLIGEGEGKGGARGEDTELWAQAKGNEAACENDELGVGSVHTRMHA